MEGTCGLEGAIRKECHLLALHILNIRSKKKAYVDEKGMDYRHTDADCGGSVHKGEAAACDQR